ncbi:hypothetical protein OC834_007228 [Tilletia horrida]|nr:hypothetical protein OC834_007228 [Tilletia horrida]
MDVDPQEASPAILTPVMPVIPLSELTSMSIPQDIAMEADATPQAAPTRPPTVDLDKIEAATLRVILTNRAIAFEKGAKGKRLRHVLDAAAKDDPVTDEEVAKAAIEVKAAALQARATRKKTKAASGASTTTGSIDSETNMSA